MTTLSASTARRSPITTARWAVVDSWTVAKRNLLHVASAPEQLVGIIAMPIIFIVLFGYVFGSAITVPGGNYREFLMAGIFAQSMGFLAAGAAVGAANDMTKGVMDRFRTLPMSRAAALTGRAVGELIMALFGIAVMSVVGLVAGWGAHRGMLPTVEGYALLGLFGFSMNWIGTVIGLSVRSVEAADTIGMASIFPLTFLANSFVPSAGLPDWLRPLAEWNPVSAVVAACRDLFGNPGGPTHGAWSLQHPVATTLLWCAAILAVTVPIALRKFRDAA